MFEGSLARPTLAALGLLVAGGASGLLPVGAFATTRPNLCVLPHPVLPPEQPFCKLPVATGLALAGQGQVGPIAVEATLVPGDNGERFLHVRLAGLEQSQKKAAERRPVDFALVVDTSGSMTDENRIGLLKKACLDLASRLGPEDRVALVEFSTEAREVFPLGPVSERFKEAVKDLVARGGTCISDGLELGVKALANVRPGVARRVILMTDGQANTGIVSADGLGGMARNVARQGVSLTTIGLGLEFNSSLLSNMAELGGGGYHHADRPDRIAGIYDAELRSLRTLVAQRVSLEVQLDSTLELAQVIEWSAEQQAGSRFTVNVGDFEAGRTAKIVARLKARPFAGESVRDVKVTVRLDNALTGSKLAGELALGSSSAVASIPAHVATDIADARASVFLEEARAKASQGNVQDARTALQNLKQIRRDVSYQAADGVTKSMSVDELQGALLAPGGGADYEAAEKFTRSAARANGK